MEDRLSGVKALFFDVFGTVVDWRSTVRRTLHAEAENALRAVDSAIPNQVREIAEAMTSEDWGKFAQRWREAYYNFTRSVAQDEQMPYKSVDEHNLDSLYQIIGEWQLDGLWAENTVKSLSLVWHELDPWSDSVAGIKALNKRFQTCTLSNGNESLLLDMAKYAHLEWTHVFSADMFKTYKPNPKVYLGGAGKLNLKPHECAMVACHLNDLEAARNQGFRTVYVERPREEQWDDEKVTQARTSGWVDIWITDGENGFLSVAESLGIV